MINLTQHPASAEQAEVGVVDLTGPRRVRLIAALTASTLPERWEIERMAATVVAVAGEFCDQHMLPVFGQRVMIGGAPWLMATLERHLKLAGFVPEYAFSMRESTESVQPDGSTLKSSVFKHAGFVVA